MITDEQAFEIELQNLSIEMAELDGGQQPQPVPNQLMARQQEPERRPRPGPEFNTLDPITRNQAEAGRRAIADRTFEKGAPVAANLAFEATGLPTMHRGVGHIDQGLRSQNALLALGGAGEMALGALPFGLGSVAGKVASKAVPGARQLAEKAAGMTGVSGFLAQRAPVAAGLVGATEGTKAALGAGRAAAADAEMKPPPATTDPTEIQTFLVSQGYPIKIDGNTRSPLGGPKTRAAWKDYGDRYRRWQEQQNSPEMRAAKQSLMQGQAAQAQAEAGRLRGLEADRRGNVLKDAEKRYDNRQQSLGDKTRDLLQSFVGPAVMVGGALAGGGAITKRISRDKSIQGLDELAKATGRVKSNAERRAFIKTYDAVTRGTPIKDTAITSTLYAGFIAEMALAEKYLIDAREQQKKALIAFEEASKGGQLDGGKEKELADAIVKANRLVEKWEGLQGAGLHGMGFLMAGKAGGMVKPKRKPEAGTTNLRNTFSEELRGPTVRDRVNALMPDPRPRGTGPAPQGGLPGEGRPGSGLPSPSGPVPSGGQPGVPGGPMGGLGPGTTSSQGTLRGPSPGTGIQVQASQKISKSLLVASKKRTTDAYIALRERYPRKTITPEMIRAESGKRGLKGKDATDENINKHLDDLEGIYRDRGGGGKNSLDRLRENRGANLKSLALPLSGAVGTGFVTNELLRQR